MAMTPKGSKFRAYPTAEQAEFIRRTCGCARLIHNKALKFRKVSFANGVRVGYKETNALLTSLKRQDEFAFLNEADSMALQQSLRDLQQAYVNFWEHGKDYPVFHSKHEKEQSYRTLNQKGSIRIENNRIRLPKLGWMKIHQSKVLEGEISNVTVSYTAAGKYFVSICCKCDIQPRANNGGVVGIDVGLKEFYTDSNGNSVANPRCLEKAERKLAREQRRLSRKQKGSSNYEKQRIKVARIHEHVANQRNDFLQKQSTMLIRENQTICIEHLCVKNMLRNHKLAKHISSVSWSKFFRMLDYKAQWYGNTILRVPTTYPSSQTCHCCGYKNPLVKNLGVREWDCPECGTHHDRDYNAAINILVRSLNPG
jgi:putative transposase